MTIGRDRGSATFVVCAVIAVGSMLSVHVAHVGRSIVGSARAQAIADAVALAGVLESKAGAERIARANDARLITFDEISSPGGAGSTLAVVIDTGTHRARAWASDRD